MQSNFKAPPLRVSDLPVTEAVYAFVDGASGTPTHIAASTLLGALEAANWPVHDVHMGQGLIDAITRGDLNEEQDHALKLPDEALASPILVGEWGQEHIIIDGSHRLWRLYERGDRTFPARVVPEKLWRAFTIRDMPGSGAFWDDFNRTAKVRTPEMERLLRLLGGSR